MATKASKLKIILLGLGLLLLGLALALRLWQSEWKPQGETDLKFTKADLPFSHEFDRNSLPFAGSAAFDIDGDGIDELFIGGGRGQTDGFFKFEDGRFKNMNILIARDDDSATHGAAHLDVDDDGDVDLFTARESGVWLHLNNGNNSFESRKLEFGLDETTTPLSIALGDVNKDGWVDLYISGYIKNELVDGTTNFSDAYGGYSYLLLNNGDNTWSDVSKEAGVWRQHNTFTAVFADLDNDLDSDLVIAQDTGVIEMYENTGSFPMKRIANPSVNSYPMGLAVGDYNNDGLVDIYTSNVGHTLPSFMLRGDLPKGAPLNTDYILLRNDGDLKFTDVTREAGIARLGFGWGTVFADLDMDGYLDLLAAQNYVKMPSILRMKMYSGKVMRNNGNSEFSLVGKSANAPNKAFGITPLVADFNGDSHPDIIWVNIDGASHAYLSKGDMENAFSFRLENNTRSLGAFVHYPVDGDTVLTRQIIAGQGLGSDQTRTIFVPRKLIPTINNLKIEYQDGTIYEDEE